MAETTKFSVEQGFGCGFIGGIFQAWSYCSRRKTVPLLAAKASKDTVTKLPCADNSKKPSASVNDSKRRSTSSNSEESAPLDSSNLAKPSGNQGQKPVKGSEVMPSRHSNSQQKNHGKRHSDATRSSTSSSSSSGQPKSQKESTYGNSTELARAISTDFQLSNDSKALVRATSSNVMLIGRLGNLRQPGTGSMTVNNSPNATVKAVDYLYRDLQEVSSKSKPRYGFSKLGGNGAMGNIIRHPSDEIQQSCRCLKSKFDPEALKNMGNEAYKQGRFEEALSLYERAISLDSKKAAYWSNKSAALVGLGRLMEAVFDCKEAIRLDPDYYRAHHRLATIYRRLGEAVKALYHYKDADPKDTARAQSLLEHLKICTEARKSNQWNTLLKETQCAISTGADSAPQVYALQVEALLKLHRHQEAHAVHLKGPNFAIESCTKIFGLSVSAYILMIKAQIHMLTGRFEDAIAAAQQAARLDPSNKEVSLVVKRSRAVSSARISGNLLFRASKFSQACIVYSEGLEHDPYNSVLLCNRAACRSKLGQFEKAIEDCSAALKVQPSYGKARLRRADCNAKLERWEAAIQDYEMLIRETPGDEEVAQALFEAQVQLKKQRGEDVKDMKFGSNLVLISTNERFRHFVTSPGMTVVLFCNKANHRQVLQLMEQVCKRFPSVNFLKVEVEDHPYLAKSEALSYIPAFKIYKNGSRVKEIPGNNGDLLEKSVKLYSS